jgi:hypothetical protein
MKAVDPEIKIFAPDEAAYLPDFYKALLLDDKLSVAGRDVNGHWYIDGVSFHNYPNGKDYNRSDVIFYSVTKMRGMIQDLLADIARADAKYQRFGDDRLLWGLTEFNITYANPDDLSVTGFAVPSFINGQFWAEVFAMGMEYSAFTMTAWCIQESDRPSTYFGYIGGPPDFWPHSTYYHTQMLAENMKGEYVKMGADNPYVKVFGSRSDEGSTVVLLNQDSAKTFAFDLGRLNQPAAEGKLAIKAAAPIKTTFAGSIEPNSTLVLVFNRKGELQKELLYNLELAAKNQAPKRVR